MLLLLDHTHEGIRGGEIYFLHLYKFLKSNFENVHPKEIQRQQPQLEKILYHARHSLRLVKKLRPTMIETDISSGLRNILAVRWAKKHGSKILIVFMERRMVFRLRNFVAVKWLVRQCENYLLRNADIVIVISQYCYKEAKAITGENTAIVVAYPGLQIPLFSAEQVAEFSRDNKETVDLLFVGASDWGSKGIRYLIKAIALLNGIDVRLNIVGGYNIKSHEHRKLEKLIKRYKLRDIVKFHGYVDSQTLIGFYKSSNIFVLPSLTEGYGMALAEAISFGLPVVASNVAAIPEMLENNVNAILVPPGNTKSLAGAIRKLVHDKALREKMSRCNLERARLLPNWNDFDNVLAQKLIPAIEQMTTLRQNCLDKNNAIERQV